MDTFSTGDDVIRRRQMASAPPAQKLRSFGLEERHPPRALLAALGAYAFATTLHFLHNGYFLEQYPNMPEWISRDEVLVSLAIVHLLGFLGCALLYIGASIIGYVALAAYAALGFDGLAHYSLAGFTRHTVIMNFTILFEVLAAAVLFIAVAAHAAGYLMAHRASDDN